MDLVTALAEALDDWGGTMNMPPDYAEKQAKFLIKHIQNKGYNIDLYPRRPGMFRTPNLTHNP